jgi:hypothetical protein
MAIVTIASTASVDMNSLTHAPYVSGLVAGEDLPVAGVAYIKSDGKVYSSASGVCTVSNVPDYTGFTPAAVSEGDPVTLFRVGARFNYSSGMTPGALFWVGTGEGKLSDAKLASADTPVAVAVSATDILIIR